ncbi:MAG: LD-carboxypeptidase [Chitinophagaceae bacterium]
MIKIPPYLTKGDTIGMVCPAGYMSREKVEACMNSLQAAGYHVVLGNTVGGSSETYFSGTDEERLDDLQMMIDDDKIKAILCARGGYGTGRIIDKIDFSRFAKKPKWIIGFSDITVIHSHLYANYQISSLHAPMAAAFNHGEAGTLYTNSLLKALGGKKLHYECAPHVFNRKGEAVGELIGGNLTMLSHLIGTRSDIKTRARIIFLEDVGEYLYNIDRMLYQLKRSGKLDKLAGVIIGGFSDLKDTERPFGKTVYEIIHDIFNGYDYPICYNFPVSHDMENVALKIGVGYKLRVGKNKVTLEE